MNIKLDTCSQSYFKNAERKYANLSSTILNDILITKDTRYFRSNISLLTQTCSYQAQHTIAFEPFGIGRLCHTLLSSQKSVSIQRYSITRDEGKTGKKEHADDWLSRFPVSKDISGGRFGTTD